jgi:hypothetical protein
VDQRHLRIGERVREGLVEGVGVGARIGIGSGMGIGSDVRSGGQTAAQDVPLGGVPADRAA